jgi:hypothetical protein
VTGGIIATTCHWGKYIEGPGPPGGGLDARVTTLLYKKRVVEKSKEVKTGSNLTESSKECYGTKSAVLPLMMMMNPVYSGLK